MKRLGTIYYIHALPNMIVHLNQSRMSTMVQLFLIPGTIVVKLFTIVIYCHSVL
jgi:hypothetical protein